VLKFKRKFRSLKVKSHINNFAVILYRVRSRPASRLQMGTW